jgi:ADP-ribose pyrophosphatase
MSETTEELEVLLEGSHLRMVRRGKWEFVERVTAGGAVVIVAVTPSNKVILIEQSRPPVDARVIEFPAGLVGDRSAFEGEAVEIAAERELLEETGYAAEQMDVLSSGPPSPGLSNEMITFVRATGLRKVGEGGGVDGEEIEVHEVPVTHVGDFLRRASARGAMVDPKIYAGLYFLGLVPSASSELSIDIPVSRHQRIDSPIGLALADELLESVDALLPPLPESGRVAVLGGSFNPPHVGHALLAHAILATEDVDEMWVIPVGEHPFGKDSVGFDHRVAMCREAFAMLGDRVKVVEVEQVLPRPSYTVQTLSALHAVRAGIEPTLVIGSDIVPELPRWRDPEKLPVLSRLIVVPRQGAPEIEPSDEFDIKIYRGFRLPKVSSTAIKKALKHGENVEGLLDKRVLDYIRTNDLYG